MRMTESKVKWHLVLFADGSYDLRAAGKRLKRQAEASGFFATVTLDNKRTLARDHSEFFLSVKDFISKNPKGFGKWIWKPYLILSKLKEIDDKEGVLYLDAGCYLNLESEKARLRFTDYFAMAVNHGSLAMQLYDFEFSSPDLTDSRHSKPFLLNFPSIKKQYYQTNQVQAGIVFFMKNKQNLKLTHEWQELTLIYNQLLSDEEYLAVNNLTIADFNWDQSIFSLLYKQSRLFCLSDETYYFPKWADGNDFPIWAMRWKRGRDPLKFRFTEVHLVLISNLISNSIRFRDSIIFRFGVIRNKL
jgi:hypothetical protein